MNTIIKINTELDRKQLKVIAYVVHKIAPQTTELKYEYEEDETDEDEFYEYLEALGGYPDYF